MKMNSPKLQEMHKDLLLARLFHDMSMEERRTLMRELPQAYNAYVGPDPDGGDGDHMILFIVTHENTNVVCLANGREEAKTKAFRWCLTSEARATAPTVGNPDKYVVSPLTKPGDRIHFDITTDC
jgi:hypothetical protein